MKRKWAAMGAGAFGCVAAFAAAAFAEGPATTVRIEEDWVLQVHEADPDTSSPQVTTQMFPHTGQSGTYALFCLNYQEIPEFHPGGLELQLWGGEEVLDVDSHNAYELSAAEETVRWTKSLAIQDGRLSIQIKNGESDSFGPFGGGNFKVSHPTSLTNLDGYRVEDSVEYSGVPLGANRVVSLKIVEVRYFKSDDSVSTDSTERVVYEHSEGSE